MDNGEIRENAYEDYIAGMKYKDIAEKYGVAINTIKSWKTRYGWSRGNKDAPYGKSMHTKKEKVCTQKNKDSENGRALAEWIGQMVEESGLTSKQVLFCMYYANSNNATSSYKKAYGCNRETAMAAGSRMLRNVKVREEIERLKKDRYEAAMFGEQDIFQWHLDIATASITDYVSFGREEIPLVSMKGPVLDKKGKPVTKEVNYVKFKESGEVDGRAIKKVKMGKDGASIELYDAFKSMEWLEKNLQSGTECQQGIASQIIMAYKGRTSGGNDR